MIERNLFAARVSVLLTVGALSTKCQRKSWRAASGQGQQARGPRQQLHDAPPDAAQRVRAGEQKSPKEEDGRHLG